MPNQVKQNEYAKAVSLFLAELLRTHKTSLTRAAEIAEKVLQNINLIDTEQQFLEFVKILSSDFEELHHLGEVFHMHVKITERRYLEEKVRMFVIQTISSNTQLAADVLQDAVKDEVSMEGLSGKFPDFKQYISGHPSNNAGSFHDGQGIEEGLNT